MPGNIINRRGRFVYEILTAEGQFISRHVDGLKRFVGNVEKYQRFEEDQEWTKVKMKQPANLPTDNTTNNSAVVEIEEISGNTQSQTTGAVLQGGTQPSRARPGSSSTITVDTQTNQAIMWTTKEVYV